MPMPMLTKIIYKTLYMLLLYNFYVLKKIQFAQKILFLLCKLISSHSNRLFIRRSLQLSTLHLTDETFHPCPLLPHPQPVHIFLIHASR